jgi:hypothetical protein
MILKILFFIALFFFFGCDGDIVKNIYNKDKIHKNIQNTQVVASDKLSHSFALKSLQERGIAVQKSHYELRVELRDYKKTCTNPLSKTSSDFNYDGLVTIALFYDGEKVYESFKDFKGEPRKALFDELLDSMIDDLR